MRGESRLADQAGRWSTRTCRRATRRSTASGCLARLRHPGQRHAARQDARRVRAAEPAQCAASGSSACASTASPSCCGSSRGRSRCTTRTRRSPRPPARAARASKRGLCEPARPPAPPGAPARTHRPHRPHARPAAGRCLALTVLRCARRHALGCTSQSTSSRPPSTTESSSGRSRGGTYVDDEALRQVAHLIPTTQRASRRGRRSTVIKVDVSASRRWLSRMRFHGLGHGCARRRLRAQLSSNVQAGARARRTALLADAAGLAQDRLLRSHFTYAADSRIIRPPPSPPVRPRCSRRRRRSRRRREFIAAEERGVDARFSRRRGRRLEVTIVLAPSGSTRSMSLRAPSADDDVPTWSAPSGRSCTATDADGCGRRRCPTLGTTPTSNAERLQHALVFDARRRGAGAARQVPHARGGARGRPRGGGAGGRARRRRPGGVCRDAAPRPLELIVKPRRGQASVRVGRASSEAQARHMLGMLLEEAVSLDDESVPGAPTALLHRRPGGRRWAVDTVSRDGEHKCVARGGTPKGEANGAPFVEDGDELMAVAGEREESLVTCTSSAASTLWAGAGVRATSR